MSVQNTENVPYLTFSFQWDSKNKYSNGFITHIELSLNGKLYNSEIIPTLDSYQIKALTFTRAKSHSSETLTPYQIFKIKSIETLKTAKVRAIYMDNQNVQQKLYVPFQELGFLAQIPASNFVHGYHFTSIIAIGKNTNNQDNLVGCLSKTKISISASSHTFFGQPPASSNTPFTSHKPS